MPEKEEGKDGDNGVLEFDSQHYRVFRNEKIDKQGTFRVYGDLFFVETADKFGVIRLTLRGDRLTIVEGKKKPFSFRRLR